MPQSCSSEKSIVSTVLAPVRLDSGNLVVHDDSGYHNRLDLEDLSYTNRELVNLENAAVNIENSSDVIIGPVTQFNVNGNVTIYQNGQENAETENRVDDGGIDNSNCAKLPKNEKFPYFDARHIVKRKACKLLVLLLLTVVLLIISTVIIVNIVRSRSSLPIEQDEVVTSNSIHLDGGKYNLITKAEWGGRDAVSRKNITLPVKMVVVKHTGGRQCLSFGKCAGIAQSIQSANVADGYPDIYYNFMVGGEGNVYEGRGFDAQPQYHVDMYDVVFFGSYDFDYPTNESLNALRAFLGYAVKTNKLDKDYKLVNHNQTFPTQSPGLHLIKEIVKFPHYDPGQYFSQPLA